MLNHDLFRRGSIEPSSTTGDARVSHLLREDEQTLPRPHGCLASASLDISPAHQVYNTARLNSTAELQAACSLPAYVHGLDISLRGDDVASNDPLPSSMIGKCIL
jgi:hypothetical protein